VAVRCQLREADRVPVGEQRVAGAGVRVAQHSQHRARDGRGRAIECAEPTVRVPDALRDGRSDQGGDPVARLPRPHLHALRPTAARHGVPRPPTVGELVERLVPARELRGRTVGGVAADEPQRPRRASGGRQPPVGTQVQRAFTRSTGG
jgi:hypothetical protein